MSFTVHARNSQRWECGLSILDLLITIIMLVAIRQMQINPPIFSLNLTMLMLLIHTYTPCVDCSPYQANVFSDVIMCLITSCVSDAMLYVRIQSSTKTFVLLYFSSSKNPSLSCSWKNLSFLPSLTLSYLVFKSECQCLKTDFVRLCIDTPTPKGSTDVTESQRSSEILLRSPAPPPPAQGRRRRP